MGNFLPKMTEVETPPKESSSKNMEQLKHLAHEFLGINGRQFAALYSCIAEVMKDAREQDLARALHSMQEKMDQNSKETSTMLCSVVKRLEKVIKDLVAKESSISSEERQQIEANMKDDIRKLKDGAHALNQQMKMWERAEDDIAKKMNNISRVEMQLIEANMKDDIRKLEDGVQVLNQQMELRKMAEDEIKIAKKYVKKTASEMKSKLYMQTENYYNMGEIRTLKQDVDIVTNEMSEVREELESQENELGDVKTALKSLKDKLKDVTEELESVKDVATKSAEDIACELRNVKERTSGAKDEQRELTEAGLGLRKVVMDANLTTESNEKEGSAQADHDAQNVRQAVTFTEASKEEVAKLSNCNNMKRNRDSRYPTFEQNKRMRNQSTREHDIASAARKIVYSSSTSSSETDSSASSFPSKINLNTNLNFGSDSSDSESDF